MIKKNPHLGCFLLNNKTNQVQPPSAGFNSSLKSYSQKGVYTPFFWDLLLLGRMLFLKATVMAYKPSSLHSTLILESLKFSVSLTSFTIDPRLYPSFDLLSLFLTIHTLPQQYLQNN
jgi:hypothetical protein